MAVDLNLVGTIVGIIGNVISFGLFAAQAPIFYKIIKKGALEEDFSPNRYLAVIHCCALWVFYGLPIVSQQNVLISIMNGVGLVMEIAYILTYCIYADKNQRWYVAIMLALEALVYTIVVVLTLTLSNLQKISSRTNFVGAITLFVVLLMRVNNYSVEEQPLFLLFANVLNGLTWMTYGLLGRMDILIVTTFSLVAMINLVQIILLLAHGKSTTKITEASTTPDIEN